MVHKIRLFVDHPLGQAQTVPLSKEQSNYLFSVMRLQEGAQLSLINSRDGEWQACVSIAHKKSGILTCLQQVKPLQMPPDLWLAFALIKKDRMGFIVEKAVELGVRRVIPVVTEYTNQVGKLRVDKLQAQMLEAAEQCGATYVPELAEVCDFSSFLNAWPQERQLMFCDETQAYGMQNIRVGQDIVKDAKAQGGSKQPSPWGIVVGPEGGFSPQERAALHGLPMTQTVSLGPRILRAETACVAAIALWQSQYGDWE